MTIKAYIVKDCKVSHTNIFTGYVLNIDDEPIIESIKRKTGCKNLLCEETNEEFEYDRVNWMSVPATELTLGELFSVFGILNSRRLNV